MGWLASPSEIYIETLMEQMNYLRLVALILQGFSYHGAKDYLLLQGKADPRKIKQIMRLLPFHTTYDEMFRDYLTARRVLWQERENFPEFCALVAKRDEQRVIGHLDDIGIRSKLSVQDVLQILREKRYLWIRDCYNALNSRIDRVECGDRWYYVNDEPVSEGEMYSFLERMPLDSLIVQGFSVGQTLQEQFSCRCPVVHITYVQEEKGPVEAGCYLTDHADEAGAWKLYQGGCYSNKPDMSHPQVCQALEIARRISQQFPDAPYLNIACILTDEGPKIWQVDTGKELVWNREYPKTVKVFLEKRQSKVKRNRLSPKRIAKYLVSYYAKRKGFLYYMYRNWLRGLWEDIRLDTTTWKEKRWAHKRGFYSYRIRQYGLTEENYRSILSDYDYKRLRPINGKYQKWLWDKEFMYYVLQPYRRYLPQYYYRIVPHKGGNRVFSFLDAKGEPRPMEDVANLIRQKRLLTLKASVGSHGKNFYRLEWEEATDQVLVNGKPRSMEAFLDWISQMKTTQFLSEFISMHSQLQSIYPGVTGTIRIMVIDTGKQPKAMDAYFRIGTRASGNTDNLGSGAIAARVDMESGCFDRAEVLVNHQYFPCTVHPDTGVPLRGVLPYWPQIKEAVEEVAAYLYPIEYLGFDVVVTQEGFRILEINTHQDLHRYTEYPQEVRDYLMRKNALKRGERGKSPLKLS